MQSAYGIFRDGWMKGINDKKRRCIRSGAATAVCEDSMERTIAAISTPCGVGGISIIRISGADAVEIGARIFSAPVKLKNAESHTMHYGFVNDMNGEHIDRVLVSVMRAPKTYTGEDVVEINAHGGTVVTNRVLAACIEAGAYPAEPGEFTKRAFLNGKLDLSEAEAVIDIINAGNELERKNALGQLEGSLSDKINALRDRLISLSAAMQVAIDYPDEELEDVTRGDIESTIAECRDEVQRLAATSDNGQLIRNGIKTAIAGKPNVGKSSLLNRLSGINRAIVTEVAGTTRDVIEEYISLGGLPLKLMDTAGIHDTKDEIERMGVERSWQSIEGAELVLVLTDAVRGIDDEDMRVIDAVRDKKHIILVNKTDIAHMEDMPEGAICISAKTGEGIAELEAEIRRLYELGGTAADGTPVITNLRHKAALLRASESLDRALVSLRDGMPQDIITIDMNDAMDSLGEITGASVSDDVVAEIFSRFCVGK